MPSGQKLLHKQTNKQTDHYKASTEIKLKLKNSSINPLKMQGEMCNLI